MQKALTVVLKLLPAKAYELERVLNIIGRDIRGVRRGEDKNEYIDFTKFQTVHFMRWVLLPNDVTGKKEYLLFTTNYDGDLQVHLNEFIDCTDVTVDVIFGSCEGYPKNRTTDPARFRVDFKNYILRHSWDWEAFYVGYRGETFHNVRSYIAVRRQIQDFLDLPQVQQFAAEHLPHLLKGLPVNIAKPNVLQPLFTLVREALKLLGFILDLLWQLIRVFILRPIKRMLLRRERALNLTLIDKQIRPYVAEIEDVVTQNQMTVISRIKPGIQHIVRLKIVLMLVNLVAKHYQNQGVLGGIVTIHFARWVILDNGRYLLFESNYDGSWESYIGEFVDKAYAGMDAVWWTTPDFPPNGSRDIDGFKDIIRRNQLQTQVFYSSYPNDTIRNILNDRAISKALEQSQVQAWLARF